MKVYQNIELHSLTIEDPLAITIGHFDGCHVGHQQLINQCLTLAHKKQIKSAALTFNPTAHEFFHPKRPKERLFTDKLKLAAFAELGLDVAIVAQFNQSLAQQSHEDFFEQTLIKNLQAQGLVVGYNFTFGYKARGNVAFLQKQTEKKLIELKVVPPVLYHDEPVSSSRIRKALKVGAINQANAMLGRPYVLQGRIKKGQQLGRQLGFPTANLGDIEQLIPQRGVYAGYLCKDDGHVTILSKPSMAWPCVINIGVKPSIPSHEMLSVEAHIFSKDFNQNLYGDSVMLFIENRLRDEIKFDSLSDLQQAIERDIQHARQL